MRLPEDINDYLCGTKYSNALEIAFEFEEEDYKYKTQIDILCEMAKDKKVIHLGCVDHTIETIKHKIKRKKWLHGRLCQISHRCHGIDIEATGIRYIQEELGFNDTSCTDIFSPEFQTIAAGDSWDHLFIPEVLEHIDDPQGFLSAIASRYSHHFNSVVITVPNGISQDNWKLAKKGVEVINSDHRYWFTPFTLAKAVSLAGMRVEKILMCRHGTINWRAIRRNRFYRKNPLLRNDILCVASLI